MKTPTGRLYIADEIECFKEVDLSAYDSGDLPTVIIFQGQCFVYRLTTDKGQVAEYQAALTLRID